MATGRRWELLGWLCAGRKRDPLQFNADPDAGEAALAAQLRAAASIYPVVRGPSFGID